MKKEEVETKHILHIPTGLTYPVIVNKGLIYDLDALFILAQDQSNRRLINPKFLYSMAFESFLTKCSRLDKNNKEYYNITYDIIEFESV